MRAAPLALLCALALAACGDDAGGGDGAGDDRGAAGGGSTARSTLVDPDGDGILERGPGEPLADRTDLAPAGPPGRTLATVGTFTDPHVRDEESPARVPFVDRFGEPVASAFRPQEALSTQVLTATVRAVNAQRPDAVVVTGDILDNAQRNELALARAVLDGGAVRPDSGRPGYRGVQEAANPDPLYYRPDQDAPRHPGLLAAAQRPFRSPGLDAPWHPVIGNHDVLRQGELTPSPRTDAVALGGRLTTTLDRDFRLPEGQDAATAVDALLDAGVPGRSITVPPDPERAALSSRAAVADLGRGRSLRSPGRLDYAVDLGPGVRGLVLDTANREGGAQGIVSPEQVAWLRAQLAATGGREVLVFSHNRLESTIGGDAAVAALAESPRVLANVAGHVHRNRIGARPGPAGGYWVIETASLADFPMQARMLRVRETRGGGRILETWMVDHDGRGAAGTARDLAYLDAQGGRPIGAAGARRDRNVRLHLPRR